MRPLNIWKRTACLYVSQLKIAVTVRKLCRRYRRHCLLLYKRTETSCFPRIRLSPPSRCNLFIHLSCRTITKRLYETWESIDYFSLFDKSNTGNFGPGSHDFPSFINFTARSLNIDISLLLGKIFNRKYIFLMKHNTCI